MKTETEPKEIKVNGIFTAGLVAITGLVLFILAAIKVLGGN